MHILKQQHQVAELLAFLLLGMQARGKRLAVAAYMC